MNWFIALCVMAMAHYVYESIWLPTFRQQARNKLFSIRDKLRYELICLGDSADHETKMVFKMADRNLNRAINNLHVLTIVNMVRVDRAHAMSEELRAEANRRNERIESCSNKVPKMALDEVNSVLGKVFLANSLGLIVYLLPIVLTVIAVKSLYGQMVMAKETLFQLVTSLPNEQTKPILGVPTLNA
ncbi:hypothetical protein [Aeromonas caviae]|uniref:hypothetical protein n=1 Tax=Aeromonas caviae TaxID=648 RepID=UPI0038D0F079